MKKLLFCLSLFLAGSSFAFAQKNLDSLLHSASLRIYENPDKAIEIGKTIFNASKDNIKRQADALLLISIGYSSKRDYNNSLKYSLQAEQLLKKTNNDNTKIKILMKIAAQYQQMNIYDKSIEYLDKTEQLIKTYPYKDSIRLSIGSMYTLRGLIYRDQINCETANKYFNQAISEYKKVKFALANANLSITYYNKGNCFISMEKMDSANYSLKKSLEYAQKNGSNSLEAFSLKGLSEVYTLEGKHEEAISNLRKGMEISKDVGDLVLNQGIYGGLSNNYLALGDLENYKYYQELYQQTKEKINTTEKSSINTSLHKLQENYAGLLLKQQIFYRLCTIVSILAALFLIGFNIKKYKKKASPKK